VKVTSPSGAFTENDLINLSNFKLNNTAALPPGTGLDHTYALYVQFNAAGMLNSSSLAPAAGSTNSGTFSSLTYSLIAASGTPTFSASTAGGSVSSLTGAVTLATGSLTAARSRCRTPWARVSPRRRP
jgi:hypothetical protein